MAYTTLLLSQLQTLSKHLHLSHCASHSPLSKLFYLLPIFLLFLPLLFNTGFFSVCHVSAFIFNFLLYSCHCCCLLLFCHHFFFFLLSLNRSTSSSSLSLSCSTFDIAVHLCFEYRGPVSQSKRTRFCLTHVSVSVAFYRKGFTHHRHFLK